MSKANITHWYTVRDSAIEASLASRPRAYTRFHQHPRVICACGEEFHVHDISTKKGDRRDCDGFQATKVIWRECRDVEVQL